MGFGCIFLLGYRVHISIIPIPYDRLDTLVAGFYGSVAIQCMKEGIIPSHIRAQFQKIDQLTDATNFS